MEEKSLAQFSLTYLNKRLKKEFGLVVVKEERLKELEEEESKFKKMIEGVGSCLTNP